MRYISKQFSVRLRDILNSFIVGVITPSLFAVVEFLSHGTFDFTSSSWRQTALIGVTAFIANISRKLLEPTKVIHVTSLSDTNVGSNGTIGDIDGDGDDRTLPPPIGDPTNPKK